MHMLNVNSRWLDVIWDDAGAKANEWAEHESQERKASLSLFLQRVNTRGPP